MLSRFLGSIGIGGSTRGLVFTRDIHVRAETVDKITRTVDAVIATESQAFSFNMRTGRLVLEVYLADGFIQLKKRQVPLLDTHDRSSTSKCRGSVRNLRISGGDVIGTLHFGSSPQAVNDWMNVRDGHLTDVSGGFRPMRTTEVRRGKAKTIKGRVFTAPAEHDLFVHTRWSLGEVSLACIGADADAKIRQRLAQSHKPAPAVEPAPILTPATDELIRREAVAAERLRQLKIIELPGAERCSHIIDPALKDRHATPGSVATKILKYLGPVSQCPLK